MKDVIRAIKKEIVLNSLILCTVENIEAYEFISIMEQLHIEEEMLNEVLEEALDDCSKELYDAINDLEEPIGEIS